MKEGMMGGKPWSSDHTKRLNLNTILYTQSHWDDAKSFQVTFSIKKKPWIKVLRALPDCFGLLTKKVKLYKFQM
jgi:hypothetical protein